MALFRNKKFRGVVKMFVPYFVQASYARRMYGIDSTPSWHNRRNPLSCIVFAVLQVFPYGLVANRSVLRAHAGANDGHAASVSRSRGGGVSVCRLAFEVNEEAQLTPELIVDVHRRVLEGLYPKPQEGAVDECDGETEEVHA